mgnify:CR=1 FL=1
MNKVETYICQFPDDVQSHLNKIKEMVASKNNSIIFDIKYGIPTAILNNKNLLHFAAFKNHIGFYPIPKTIQAFNEKLIKYKQGKGSIQFPLNEPIPFDLINEMIDFRISELKKS